MNFRTFQILTALGVALFAVQAVAPGSALAHERRTVGKYTFVVGFLGEPAIVGEPNGIDLRISDAATNEPVDGAEKTLKAAIAFGGLEPKEFPLRARFGLNGSYTADVIPTRAGAYIFTFSGTINGQQVSEKFESGPGRFSDVASASDPQFPEVVRSSGELQKMAMDAQTQAADAIAAAAQARIFGIGGIAVGILGFLVGGVALVNSRGKQAVPMSHKSPIV